LLSPPPPGIRPTHSLTPIYCVQPNQLIPPPNQSQTQTQPRHTGTGIKGYDLRSGLPNYNPPVIKGPDGGLVEVQPAP